MKRERQYYREVRRKTIKRKKSIISKKQNWIYSNEGKLAKGKIHCSCWMCRKKNYDELSHKDKVNLIKYKQQIKEIK